METLKNWLAGTICIAIFTFLVAAMSGAFAADTAGKIGGDCCADLEERIAELEATTARKDNRKVQVTIYGTISESLTDVFGSSGVTNHWQVQSNSNRDAKSVVGFKGEALVSPGYSAGFVAELGVGGFTNAVAFQQTNGWDTNGLYTNQMYVFIKTPAGKLSVGQQYVATYDLTGSDLTDAGLAHTLGSLAPLVGPPTGTALDVWDGGSAQSVKYASPHFFANGTKKEDGIWFEGDLANANRISATGVSTNGDMWDVAVKALHDFQQVRIQAKVGYEDGRAIQDPFNVLGTGFGGVSSGLALQDLKMWGINVGAKHLPTGLFITASYADLNFKDLVNNAAPGLCGATGAPTCSDLKFWAVQAGIEAHILKLGATTFFGQYETYDLSGLGLGSGNKSYGVGVVQDVNAAAMAVYASWTEYQPDSALTGAGGLPSSVDVLMTGLSIKF